MVSRVSPENSHCCIFGLWQACGLLDGQEYDEKFNASIDSPPIQLLCFCFLVSLMFPSTVTRNLSQSRCENLSRKSQSHLFPSEGHNQVSSDRTSPLGWGFKRISKLHNME